MPKKPTLPAEPNHPVEHHWECEGCLFMALGENPPNQCPICGHEYFENLADQLAELPSQH